MSSARDADSDDDSPGSYVPTTEQNAAIADVGEQNILVVEGKESMKMRSNKTGHLTPGLIGKDLLLDDKYLSRSWEDNDNTDDDESDSDSDGDALLPLLDTALKRVPTDAELRSQPTCLCPLMRSWSYIPKRYSIKPQQRSVQVLTSST
jgi:hypothetical protein